ncbi:MAG: UPF0489 family protein [Candidatus Heimdallarchaeota archaeon]
MDRILDIDLDFFLNKVSEAREDEKRLKKKHYYPWNKITLESFLENRCHLSKKNRIPGRIVNKHQKAFFFWREMFVNQKIKIPFELVHIDAHTDIGVADWGWVYITSELLHKPIEERIYPNESILTGINEANYIAFALACRWIKKLRFIIHPDWENDLIEVHFKNFDIESGFLQLKKYDRNELLEKGFEIENSLELEPEVPVEFIPIHEYKNTYPFNILTLSKSKNYTPKASDKLIKVIKSYITKI